MCLWYYLFLLMDQQTVVHVQLQLESTFIQTVAEAEQLVCPVLHTVVPTPQ